MKIFKKRKRREIGWKANYTHEEVRAILKTDRKRSVGLINRHLALPVKFINKRNVIWWGDIKHEN